MASLGSVPPVLCCLPERHYGPVRQEGPAGEPASGMFTCAAAPYLTIAVCCTQVVIVADGQVTRGSEVVKPNVRKVRRLGDGKVIGGFAGVAGSVVRARPALPSGCSYGHAHAGATADAFTLFERLEVQLDTHSGVLCPSTRRHLAHAISTVS